MIIAIIKNTLKPRSVLKFRNGNRYSMKSWTGLWVYSSNIAGYPIISIDGSVHHTIPNNEKWFTKIIKIE